MPATEKQLAANRQNAQLSTGPRSDSGKAASSQNATRHGLTARGIIVLPGQEDAFHQLESDLLGTLLPNGPLQHLIFQRALECAWNLHRCRLAQAQLYAESANPDRDPLLDEQLATQSARIQKYAREAENSMYKAMRELGKLQAEVQYRHEAYPLGEEQLNNESLFAQTPHSLSEVCSFAQVMANHTRQRRNEAKTHGIELETELKALDKLPVSEYLRRYAAPEPQPETARAAAAA